MLKKNILWIGIGEAGNRIVNEILGIDSRYIGICINSANKDTEGLDNIKDKYIIPNSNGTGKNRMKGKKLFLDDRKNIFDEITKYTTQDTFNIVFSLGGGTGGSIAPMIISGLKLLRINKPINVVCIRPGYEENKRYRKNAIECWNDLAKLDNINTYYILDNESRADKQKINKEFARQFDAFMNMPKGEKTDNAIDEEELDMLNLCKGSTVFYTLPSRKENPRTALEQAAKQSIFAELDDNIHYCKYLAIAINKNLYDYKVFSNLFDIDEYTVSSYNTRDTDLNLIVATGLKPQKTSIETLGESLREDLKEEQNIKKADNNEDDLSIHTDIDTRQEIAADVKKESKDPKELEDKLNDDDLWNKLLNM